MKKTLYSLVAFATLLFAASCAREPVNVADPALGGKPVTATFTVSFGDALTKADPATSTLDDGTLADQLYVGVFGPDGALISSSKVGENTVPVSNKSAEVTLTLTKKTTYQLVFFAQKTGAYDVNFADGNVATFSYGPNKTYNANDAGLDAFYKTMSFTANTTGEQEQVVLTRPFAQINVLVPVDALPDGKNDYSSTMTVTGAPSSFNLFTGEAVASETATAAPTFTFADAAISAESFGKYAANGQAPAKWIAMNYILVPESGLVNVSFKETDMDEPMTLTDIAVKENGRVNLVGDVYQLAGEYIFPVIINPVIGDEGEGSLDAEDTDIVLNNGDEFTANNPLAIVAGEAASVTVKINDESISAVNGYAGEGKEVTAESSDENVATAAIDGSNVVITPVGDGEAVITVRTPAYTKANYKEGVKKIYVEVSGFTVEPVDPELAVDGAPADGASVSEPLSLTVTTNSDGELSWTVDPAEAGTVAAGEKATEYIFTPADNLTEDTPVTVTFTVAATETYNEKSEAVEFTVAAAEGGEEPEEDPMAATKTETLPYSEAFTTGQGDFRINDVEKPEALTGDIWTSNSSNGMVAKAYVSNTNYPTESWLFSEDIDLTNATAPILTFSHCARFLGAISDVTLWIRESGKEWSSLAFSADVENGSSWTWKDNENDLKSYAGKKVQIAFKYTSTASAAGTYEVKNLTVEDASQPIETTIEFAKESLALTVGGSASNAVTTNSDGAKTFTSSAERIATVDEDGKVTAVAAGEATITVAVAASGRYTAAEASYTVTVTEASGGSAPVGTVLWEETWTGGEVDETPTSYGQEGTSVYGNATVTYSHNLDGTKLYNDNQIDGSTTQLNLLVAKNDATNGAGSWTITGIPTGGAKKGQLKYYVNNASSANVSSVTVTTTTQGVSLGEKTQGSETEKPFSFTVDIDFGTASTFDLIITNGSSKNFRIDDITVTVTE